MSTKNRGKLSISDQRDWSGFAFSAADLVLCIVHKIEFIAVRGPAELFPYTHLMIFGFGIGISIRFCLPQTETNQKSCHIWHINLSGEMGEKIINPY